MSTAFQTRSLYRSFWRGLWHVSRGDMGRLANLRRLYRPQIREALLDTAMDENTIRINMLRTLTLLNSSRKLTRNISSLSYHHTPYHIPHANNSNRLAHLPKPIVWQPSDPMQVTKAWENRRKNEQKDATYGMSVAIDQGLMRMWREVEGEVGDVWLGRVTKKRHGDGSLDCPFRPSRASRIHRNIKPARRLSTSASRPSALARHSRDGNKLRGRHKEEGRRMMRTRRDSCSTDTHPSAPPPSARSTGFDNSGGETRSSRWMQPAGWDVAALPSSSTAPVATAAPVAGASSGGHDRRRSSLGAVGGQQAVGWGQAAVAMAHRRSQSWSGPATTSQNPTFARPGGTRMSPPRPSQTASSTAPPFDSANFAAVHQAPQQANSNSPAQVPVDPRLYTLDMCQQSRSSYLDTLTTLYCRGASAIELALEADAMRCLSKAKLPTEQSMLAEFAPDMLVIYGCRPKDYLAIFDEYKDWAGKQGIPTLPLTGATVVYFLIDRIPRLQDRERIVQVLELYRQATIDVHLTLGGKSKSEFAVNWQESDWANWFPFVEQAKIRVHEWLAVREACGLGQPQRAPPPPSVAYYAPPPYPVVQSYATISSSAAGSMTAPPAPSYPPTTQVPPSAQASTLAYYPQPTNAAQHPAPLIGRQSSQHSRPPNPPTPTAPSVTHFQPPNMLRSNSRQPLPPQARVSNQPSPAVAAPPQQQQPVPNLSAYPRSVQPYQPYRRDAPNASIRPPQSSIQQQAPPPMPPVLPQPTAAASTPTASSTVQRRPASSAIPSALPGSEQQQPTVDHCRSRQPANNLPSGAPPSQAPAAPRPAPPPSVSHAPWPSSGGTVAHQGVTGIGGGGSVDRAAGHAEATGGAAHGGQPTSPFVVRLKLPASAPSSNTAAPSSVASHVEPTTSEAAASRASLGKAPTAVAPISQPVASTSSAAVATNVSPSAAASATPTQQPTAAPPPPLATFTIPAPAGLARANEHVEANEPPRKKRRRRRKGPLLPPEEEAEEDDFYAAVSEVQSAIDSYRHERQALVVAVHLQRTAHTRVSPWRNGRPETGAAGSAASLDLETPFGDYIPTTTSEPTTLETCIVKVNTLRDPLNALLPFPGNPPPPVCAKITSQPFPRLSRPDDAFSLAPQPFLSYPSCLRPPDDSKRVQLWNWALGLGDAAKRSVEDAVAQTGRTLDGDELERAKKAQLGAMVREAVQGASMEPLPDAKEPKLARRTRRMIRSIASSGTASGKRKDSVVLDLVDDQDAQIDDATSTKPSEIAPPPAGAAGTASSAGPVRPPPSAGTSSTSALPTVRPRADSTGAMRRRASVSGALVHPLAHLYAQAPGAMRQQLRDMSADIRGVPSDSTAGALAQATSRIAALRPNGLSAASPRIGSSKSPALASPPLVPMPLDGVDEAGDSVMNGSGTARQETVEPPVPSGSTALGVIVDSPANLIHAAVGKSGTDATLVEGGAATAVGSAVASAFGSVLRATVGAVSAAAKAVVPSALVGKPDDAAPAKPADDEVDGAQGDGAQGGPASRSETPVNVTGKRHRRCKICASAECPGRWRRDLCTAASRAAGGERRLDKGKAKADGAGAGEEAAARKRRMVAPRMHPCSVRNMRVDWLRVSEPVRPFGPFP
ncbi:putative Sulfite oxidase [Rhodotorula toruloides ATCC 204091]|nr:putative Sulfite oxidase [Rhodotorula toruloides ATCC 204091]